jgi:hypothetical protein
MITGDRSIGGGQGRSPVPPGENKCNRLSQTADDGFRQQAAGFSMPIQSAGTEWHPPPRKINSRRWDRRQCHSMHTYPETVREVKPAPACSLVRTLASRPVPLYDLTGCYYSGQKARSPWAKVRGVGFSAAARRRQFFRRSCHAPYPSRRTSRRQRRLAAAWASVPRGCPESYEAGLLPSAGSLNGWWRRAAAENPTPPMNDMATLNIFYCRSNKNKLRAVSQEVR